MFNFFNPWSDFENAIDYILLSCWSSFRQFTVFLIILFFNQVLEFLADLDKIKMLSFVELSVNLDFRGFFKGRVF